jgi:GNAT superfamily N-acetyltransferase
MTPAVLVRRSGQETLAMLDEIADLYCNVHREDTDLLFSRASFVMRTNNQARDPGFELITADVADTLVGCSFGLPFTPGRWWARATPPARQFLDASKFAVIELDVHEDHRGHGLGKQLLQTLLADRHEDFATLTAIPNSIAHAMYLRWGWYKVGEVGGDDGPLMDVLAVPLRGGTG